MTQHAIRTSKTLYEEAGRLPYSGGTGTSRLALERPPTGFSDPDANDAHRLAASFDGLLLCCCKPGIDEAGEQITGEPVGEQQRLGKAALVDGEQL